MKSIFDQEVRDEIIGRIQALNSSSKAQWGKMSVGQMVRHCILCEEYYIGKIEVKRSLLGRFIGKFAISGILKDKSSTLRKNSSTTPNLKVTYDIQNLEAEKDKWESLIKGHANFYHENFTHWFFGYMTKQQLGQLIYIHCNHHLRQFNV